MFSCASVGAACKLTKVSIDRIELATLARAKKTTFINVEKAILELENSQNDKKSKAVVNSGKDLATSLAEKADDDHDDVKPEKRLDEPKLKRKRNQRFEDDEFEEWKAAMIRKAGLAK